MPSIDRNPDNPAALLSESDLDLLASALDALRHEVFDGLGEDDAKYIRSVIALQRRLELFSRLVLLFSALPPAWAAGTIGLAAAKSIENM